MDVYRRRQNKSILEKARVEHYAVLQFNFSNFEQFKGIIKAVEKFNLPVILGTSEGESKFLGLETAVAIKRMAEQKLKLPIILNLDHGKSFEYLKKAIDAGYDMVHFDGSKLALDANIKIAKKVVEYARSMDVLVEGEVGSIGSDSSKIYMEKFEIQEEDLTKPEEAEYFCEETNVDSLAIGIGTFHGIEVRGKNPHIRFDRLKEIKEKVGKKFLVLHGGSGTPDEDVKKAIKLGIVKVNINTDIRMAFTKKLKQSLHKNPEKITPYKYMLPSITAVEKTVEKKIQLFGLTSTASL